MKADYTEYGYQEWLLYRILSGSLLGYLIFAFKMRALCMHFAAILHAD